MVKISSDKIDARSLRGNAPGDPAIREITCIENNANARTPVMIGLPGFYGSSYSFLNRSYTSIDFLNVLESLHEKYSFIIILPDTMTAFGGNQFVNSSAVGNYEDFIKDDVLDYINSKYGNRDIYLFGKSSGGFGSISLALKYPDIFNGFIDISGDSYFPYSYLPDFGVAFKTIKKNGLEEFIQKYRSSFINSQDDLTTYNVIAMSAFYSPEGKNFKLPFKEDIGEIDNDVWKKWLKLDPVNAIKENIKALKKQTVILQTGNKDEFRIDIGMNMIHNFLEKNNVSHYFKEYDTGHFNTNFFYLDSFPEILKKYNF
ncbi:MAG: alpha/beta hydrolase-fold protein [Ferroplasma sp.]